MSDLKGPCPILGPSMRSVLCKPCQMKTIRQSYIVRGSGPFNGQWCFFEKCFMSDLSSCAEKGEEQPLAAPVGAAELAAATMAHQASLDPDGMRTAQQGQPSRAAQQLSGRDAGSISRTALHSRELLPAAGRQESAAQSHRSQPSGEL